MKIKEGFVIREIMGQAVAVPTGKASEEFSGMVKLNDTGKEIWKAVAEGKTSEQIVEILVKKYEVTEEKAKSGVENFLAQMVEKGFMEN